VAASTSTGLTGDDKIKQITLPFAVTLYGTSYTSAWIDTNGLLELANPGSSAVNFNTQIPSSAKPNASIYAMWDDLIADSSSTILTSTVGTAPNRQFIVEWRNLEYFNDKNSRVSFEIILTEGSKSIKIVYGSESNTSIAHGSSALAGIENAAGTDAFQYSYHQPNLLSGRGVTFTAP
jgi:hypothetical protein